MDPRELFSKPLTYPRHEKGDIHYIGEALPAPSLAVSVLSQGTPAYVGGSSIPAREDHIHAIDLADLTGALVDLGAVEVDLSNYYTIAEVDALLALYYTAAEIDATVASIDADLLTLQDIAVDHETRITVLEAGGGASLRAEFSWPGIMNFDDADFPSWLAPDAGDFVSLWAYWEGTETGLTIETYVAGVLQETTGVLTKGVAVTLTTTNFTAGQRVTIKIASLTSYTGRNLAVILDV